MPSAIEITPQEYRNPPVAGEIEPSVAGFSEFRVPERKYELRSGKYEVRVSGFAEVVHYPNLLLRQAYMVIPRLLPPHSRGLVCLVCYYPAFRTAALHAGLLAGTRWGLRLRLRPP